MEGASSLQNRRNFLRISGEQRRKRGESEAKARRELRARGVALKNPACPHTIVQAVPAATQYALLYITWASDVLPRRNTITYTHLKQQQIDSR